MLRVRGPLAYRTRRRAPSLVSPVHRRGAAATTALLIGHVAGDGTREGQPCRRPPSAEAEKRWAEIHLARFFLAVSNPSEHVVAAVREEPAQGRRREAPSGGVLAEGRGHRRQGHPNKVSKLSNDLLGSCRRRSGMPLAALVGDEVGCRLLLFPVSLNRMKVF